MKKLPREHFEKEAERCVPHLSPEEREAWVDKCHAEHPGLTEEHKTQPPGPTAPITACRFEAPWPILDDIHEKLSRISVEQEREHRTSRLWRFIWLAIVATAVLFALARTAHGQRSDPARLPTIIRFAATNPAGNACNFASPILYYQGNEYTCSNGATYAQLTGGGGTGCTLGAVSNGQVVYDSGGNCAGVPSGNAGQIYISQGAGQPPVVADPIVSFNYTTLLSAVAATGTQTGSAVRVPLLSAYGSLAITGAAISGSPSGCQVALEAQTNVGTPASSAIATQVFTPANTYQSFAVTPSAGFGGADQLIAVYSCSVYPAAGTITAVWEPAHVEAIPFALPTGANTIGAVNQGGSWVVGQSGSWNVGQSGAPWSFNETQVNGVALGSPSNYGTSPGAVSVPGVNAFITNTPAVTATIQSNASVNEAQVNGVALGSPSAYGTSPGAVNVPGVNAFVTNSPSVTQSGTWTVQPGNTANTTPWLTTIQQGGNPATVTPANALKVDGSGVTQPVSFVASDITATGTLAALNNIVTITLAGEDSASFTLASGNNLLGTLTPEFSSDGGTTWLTSYLRASSGSTNWVTSLVVSSSTGTFNLFLPGGSGLMRVRVSAYTSGSAAVSMRASSQVENLSVTQGTPGTAAPPAATQVEGTDGTNGVVFYVDPCQRAAKNYTNISQTANTQIITGTSSKKTYICSFWVSPVSAPVNAALVEGTGSVCATNTISVSGAGGGGTGTAATGANMVANEGFTVGVGGFSVAQASVAADNVCLFQSTNNQVSGGIVWVQY